MPRSQVLTPTKKAKIFRSTGLVSFPYQVEVHSAQERFLVLDWGRRAGKSETGGREAYAQLCVPGSRVWVAGPQMDLAEKEFRVVWRLAVEQGMIPVRRKSERELWIDFDNGSFIECRSEENPDQMIGEGVDLVILAEAARMKETTWTRALQPTLADRHGRAIFSSTPRGYNWFWKYFMRGQPENRDENPNWRSWKFPSSVNPLIRPEDIAEARKNTSKLIFDQEWLADFVSYEGQVFPEFKYEVHVRAHPFEPLLRTALWADPGTTNPYALLLVQITPDETVRVLDEIYETGLVTDEIIRMAQAKWPHAMLDRDSGKPRQDIEVVIDQAAAESASTWRLAGYRAGGDKPGIKQGIEVMHRMLADPFRVMEPTDDNPEGIVPRLTFSPMCKRTIEEFGLYHYPDDARKRFESNPSELPVDKDNHSLSALKYGLYWTYPELFNMVPASDELLYATAEEMGFGEEVSRMRIDSSYAPSYPTFGREFSLGDY